MKTRLLPWTIAVVVFSVASFVAGSWWQGRRIRELEEARGKFFEVAQGQFHWPEGSKEWTEMLVPLGGVDYSSFGERWSFTAMYEGTQRSVEVRVIFKDAKGTQQEGGGKTLSRGAPDDITVDLAGMKKDGLDLKTVVEMVLRIRGDGKAGRLLVSGMVHPRPELIQRVAQ
ncbi:MAG TPA: hypothetical protein VGL59_03325 [Polyangia bacterium]|jgi:hypothetical protein